MPPKKNKTNSTTGNYTSPSEYDIVTYLLFMDIMIKRLNFPTKKKKDILTRDAVQEILNRLWLD